jgi:hypothetical protein
VRCVSPALPVGMVAVSDFSGFTSCACALARAAARAASDSLDCCTGGLRVQNIKADRTGFRALCTHPVPDRLSCIFENEALELAFRPLMLEKCRAVVRKTAANSAQEFEEFMSTMRMASMRGRGGSALIRWGTSPVCTQRQNFFSAETRMLR